MDLASKGLAGGRRSGRRSGARAGRTGRLILLAASLTAALATAAHAQGSLPVRPVVDAANGVLGAELFVGAEGAELFGGAGYGPFSGALHYRAGASWTTLRHRVTLAYQHWPGSLVEGREGQTGTGVRWDLDTFGAAVRLTGFRGTLWPLEAEAAAPDVWVLGLEASRWFRLRDRWLLTPRWSSTWGRTLDGRAFTSHLATARIRYGWTGLQLAGGTLWSDGLPGFRWRLGGGGDVPLRGYQEAYDTGLWLVGASLEHRIPLPVRVPLAQLQVALFVDGADALGPDQGLQDVRLAVGYGAGLVLATALGELHADLAWSAGGSAVPTVWLSTSF